MVVPSPTQITKSEKLQSMELPVIDMSGDRREVSKQIVRACEEYGFFKVKNHGVPQDLIDNLEGESVKFFAKPADEKQLAGPADPLGYGCRTIGFNGDMGEVEYLLFNTDPLFISQTSKTISNDPLNFSSVVSGYIEAVREVACEILDLMAEGMWVSDTSVFSKLIRDVDSDSILRVNHYPPLTTTTPTTTNHHHHICTNQTPHDASSSNKLGFGEHSDPQILTLLRSNDVPGLQISPSQGVWVPVSPDPTVFCVNVGDVLQSLTNGRLVSVRHRVVTNTYKSRMSMAYFAAPALGACIRALPQMITPIKPVMYRPFTWAEYKTAAYSLRLGDCRLDPFRMPLNQHLAI